MICLYLTCKFTMCDNPKLTHEQWTIIETALPEHSKRVLLVLQSLINPLCETNTFLQSFGENIYLSLRPLISFLNVNKSPPHMGKQLVQKDTDNVIDQLAVKQLKKIIMMTNIDDLESFKSVYVELRVIFMMYITNTILSESIDKEHCHELYSALMSAYSCCEQINGISQTMLIDLKTMIEKLRKFVDDDRINCVTTRYDTLFPKPIVPYRSQTLLSEYIKNETGLIFYASDTGKSSSIVMMIEETKTKNYKNKQMTRVLYVSSSEKSRLNVCRIAYDRVIQFTVASMCDNDLVLTCHRSSTVETSILIVADIQSAIHLLSFDSNYTLFYDDATISDDGFKQLIETRPQLSIVCVPNNYYCDEKLFDGHLKIIRESHLIDNSTSYTTFKGGQSDIVHIDKLVDLEKSTNTQHNSSNNRQTVRLSDIKNDTTYTKPTIKPLLTVPSGKQYYVPPHKRK